MKSWEPITFETFKIHIDALKGVNEDEIEAIFPPLSLDVTDTVSLENYPLEMSALQYQLVGFSMSRSTGLHDSISLAIPVAFQDRDLPLLANYFPRIRKVSTIHFSFPSFPETLPHFLHDWHEAVQKGRCDPIINALMKLPSPPEPMTRHRNTSFFRYRHHEGKPIELVLTQPDAAQLYSLDVYASMQTLASVFPEGALPSGVTLYYRGSLESESWGELIMIKE